MGSSCCTANSCSVVVVFCTLVPHAGDVSGSGDHCTRSSHCLTDNRDPTNPQAPRLGYVLAATDHPVVVFAWRGLRRVLTVVYFANLGSGVRCIEAVNKPLKYARRLGTRGTS